MKERQRFFFVCLSLHPFRLILKGLKNQYHSEVLGGSNLLFSTILPTGFLNGKNSNTVKESGPLFSPCNTDAFLASFTPLMLPTKS